MGRFCERSSFWSLVKTKAYSESSRRALFNEPSNVSVRHENNTLTSAPAICPVRPQNWSTTGNPYGEIRCSGWYLSTPFLSRSPEQGSSPCTLPPCRTPTHLLRAGATHLNLTKPNVLMADDGEGKRRRGQRGPAKDYGGASRSQPKRGAADLTRERISDVHRMEEASHFDDEGNKERKKKVARLTGTSAERASRLQEALAEYNIDFQHLPSLQARSSPMSMSADQRRRVFSLFDSVCDGFRLSVQSDGAANYTASQLHLLLKQVCDEQHVPLA